MKSPVLLWGKVFSFFPLTSCLTFPYISTFPSQYFYRCFPPLFSPSQISSPSPSLPQHPLSLLLPSPMNDSVYGKFIMCWRNQILLVLHLSSLFSWPLCCNTATNVLCQQFANYTGWRQGGFNFPSPQRLHTHWGSNWTGNSAITFLVWGFLFGCYLACLFFWLFFVCFLCVP